MNASELEFLALDAHHHGDDQQPLSRLRRLAQASRARALMPSSPASHAVQSEAAKRIAQMEYKATAKLYGLHNGKRTFEQALKILAKRWPVAVGMNHKFTERLKAIWEREDEFCKNPDRFVPWELWSPEQI